jgi:hypothetical protein
MNELEFEVSIRAESVSNLGQFLPEQLSYMRPDQLYGVTGAERC